MFAKTKLQGYVSLNMSLNRTCPELLDTHLKRLNDDDLKFNTSNSNFGLSEIP